MRNRAGEADGPRQERAVVLSPDQHLFGPGPLEVGAVFRPQQLPHDANFGVEGLQGEGGEQGALIHLGRGFPRLPVGQDDGLDGTEDIGLQEDIFPGIVPPEIENLVLGVSFFDGVHLLRRGFVDQDHRDGGRQAFEQLVQQGLGIFRPPQDQDMLRRFNGFQTFLLAKLAFNED